MSASIRRTSRLGNTWSDGVYLAWSLDRKTSFASDFFHVGPRGGLQHRYAVRLGIDHQGIAMGGCCMFTDRDEAERCFLRNAEPMRLPGAFGGTPADPDSIDVEIAR